MIRYLIFSILYKSFLRIKINIAKSQFERYSISGKSTMFYESAKIYNLQKDKRKIRIGENTHIRGEILVFAHGG